MSIESLVIDLIEGRKKNSFLKKILYFLSLFYKALISIRNSAYDIGFLKSYTSQIPVVSIGNIVAGGTGKTPLVQKIVEELSQESGEVAIITRGYRSQSEHNFVLASIGKGPLVLPAACGDEAYWLSSHTKASVWVGKHRVSSLQKAALSGARIIFLEDGFQHRQVNRDVEIVLLNAEDLLGHGYFLPRGYLRESPKRLSEADFIIVTYLKEGFDSNELLQKVRPFSKAPIIGMSSVFDLNPEVKFRKVGAFCGIAKPNSFYKALANVEVVKTLTFPDHQVPSLKELSKFALECQSLKAEYLICTEKDRVKLLNVSSLVLPVEVLKMQFKCIWNENVWKEMMHSIQNRM